jgi:hypothetical protein
MIDATKLVHGCQYWITVGDKSPQVAKYSSRTDSFASEYDTYHEPKELTAAIPIPQPAELAAMREIVEAVTNCSRKEYEHYVELHLSKNVFLAIQQLTKGRDDA